MGQGRRIAVIGGGLMGAGIAQIFASAGHDVSVCEPNAGVAAGIRARMAESLVQLGQDVAAAERVKITSSMAEALEDAWYVTEAAPERLEIKRTIFAALEEHAHPNAILASNTSVIPITRIAERLRTPQRVVGTHWWNPPTLIPLVEVIQAEHTTLATIETTMELLRSIGKQPAHVRKDRPGFVANRLQHALWREAIAMVAEGVCDAATLDACVKNSFGLRLPVLGPLENADLVGLDLTLDIHHTIMPELDRHDRPNAYLEALVAKGQLGFKSGEGFRSWTADEMKELRTRLVEHLVQATRPKPDDTTS